MLLLVFTAAAADSIDAISEVSASFYYIRVRVLTFLSSSSQFRRTFFGTNTRHVRRNDLFRDFFDDDDDPPAAGSFALELEASEDPYLPPDPDPDPDSDPDSGPDSSHVTSSTAASCTMALVSSTCIMVIACAPTKGGR